MKKLHEYIELLDEEIEELIEKEVENDALDHENEELLHLFLENRKHVKEWICELEGKK